jgi:hypothetical protein
MDRKNLVPFLVIGALALAVVTGVTVFRNVQASSPVISNVAGSVANLDFGRGFGGGGGDVTNQALATALGIDVTKLTAAQTTATDQALAQAVTKGLITQSQADQMKANGYVMRDFNQFSANGIDYKALLASALGISTDKLNAAYIQAYNTSVDAEVTSGNLTQTQADLMKARYALANNSKFQSALTASYTAAVNQAVTDGVITQSQADQILKANNGAGFDLFGGGRGGGPGFGGPGFGGHGRGGGNFPGNNNPNNTTPGSATPTPSSGL